MKKILVLGLVFLACFSTCDAKNTNKKQAKTYLKIKHKIEKLNIKKEKKQKDLNFLENRLKIKRQKLQEVTSNEAEGEEK